MDHVTEACSEVECMTDTDCTSVMSESDSQPEFFMSSPKVASIVRKELAIAIRDLMQHGLIAVRFYFFFSDEHLLVLPCLALLFLVHFVLSAQVGIKPWDSSDSFKYLMHGRHRISLKSPSKLENILCCSCYILQLNEVR